MIHVSRPVPDPVAVLDALAKPDRRKKKTELELAREYYSQTPRPKKAYEFSRYKAFEVCQALDALFHEKCAYCESTYRAVDALDVEHFRPKGAVTESPNHPGYWWLAAVWTNLLPSCPACNQLRRHLAFDPGMTLEEFDRARQEQPQQTSGKANSFPLAGGNWIADEHGDITAEDPLLINPTLRKPEDHLEWVFDWDRNVYLWDATPVIPLVRPRSVHGTDDPYGKASIAVYGLNRAGLLRERMARVKDIQLVCSPIIDAIIDLNDAQTPEQAAKLQARLERYKEAVRAFANPEKTYSGMAGAFIVAINLELDRFTASLPS